MAVCLMSYIPYYAVIRGIENVVKGNSQFNGSQTGAEMTGIMRELVNDHLSELTTHLRQLVRIELPEVIR
jgi:hypothetical protein